MRTQGFTLIEMLLSVSIITMLAAISLPLYASFSGKNDLDLTAQTVANSLRRAQSFSRGANADSAWGFELLSTSIIVFKGTTYATRDTTADETTAIPGSVTPGGTAEVDFSKMTGIPSATASITLTSNITGDIRTITVNAKGMVNY